VATAALEVLRDEKLAENAQRMGELFRQGLEAIPSNGLMRTVRGRGAFTACAPSRLCACLSIHLWSDSHIRINHHPRAAERGGD